MALDIEGMMLREMVVQLKLELLAPLPLFTMVGLCNHLSKFMRKKRCTGSAPGGHKHPNGLGCLCKVCRNKASWNTIKCNVRWTFCDSWRCGVRVTCTSSWFTSCFSYEKEYWIACWFSASYLWSACPLSFMMPPCYCCWRNFMLMSDQ